MYAPRGAVRIALCSFVSALLLLCGHPAAALPEETWLVAIGNNSGDADEVQLLFAERDAREMAEVLRGQGHIASDRVRLLIDEEVDTVRRTLVAVNAAIRARQQEGRRPTALLVFYSGHADASALHLRGSRLDFEELRGLVQSSAATMRLLIVDACRSGTVTRVKGVQAAPEFTIQVEDRPEAEGMATIASSTAGESSQESDRLRASFFSHHLVNALRGAADRNGDGRVTLSEAYDYTYAQTLRSSGRTLTLQHPTYAFDVKGSGDLVLTSLADLSRSAGRLRLGDAATYLIAEERETGAVVAELTTLRPRAEIMLPRGRYFVQQRGAAEYREYQIRLEPDQALALDAQEYRPVRYDRLVRKRGGTQKRVHGLSLLGGVRGGLLDGEGAVPELVLGYTADLPWLSVGLRLRGATVSSLAVDGALSRRHSELGLGVLLQRYVDLPWLSLSFGLSVEATYHAQVFSDDYRQQDARHGVGMGFGGLLALERHLGRGLALRIEGGPVAYLFRRALTEDGVATGSDLGSLVTYWAAGGLLWRF